jgi:hypothetical protein
MKKIQGSREVSREIAFRHRPATCAGVCRSFGAFKPDIQGQRAEIFQHRSQACARQVRILLKAISLEEPPDEKRFSSKSVTFGFIIPKLFKSAAVANL